MDEEPQKDVPFGVWLFLIIVAVLFGGWWISQHIQNVYLQNVISFFGLIVLVFYTHQTWRMQQAVGIQAATAIKQTNLSIQPIFVVHIAEKDERLQNGHKWDIIELEN